LALGGWPAAEGVDERRNEERVEVDDDSANPSPRDSSKSYIAAFLFDFDSSSNNADIVEIDE
jgi:hypothetical protein